MEEEEDFEYNTTAEQDVLRSQLNRQAYDDVSLTEKYIEPDDRIDSDYLSRNLQLGNIKGSEFKFFDHKISTAFDMFNIPFSLGGFISHDVGKSIMKTVHFSLVLSNSIDGSLRENAITKRNVLARGGRSSHLKKSLDANIKPLE